MNRTMPGVVIDKSARAFVKVTMPKSMQHKGLPVVERFGFDTKNHAKESVRNLLEAGIHAKLD